MDVWELESRMWGPACEMWEPVCRVWELEWEVWDPSSHQLPLNLTPAIDKQSERLKFGLYLTHALPADFAYRIGLSGQYFVHISVDCEGSTNNKCSRATTHARPKRRSGRTSSRNTVRTRTVRTQTIQDCYPAACEKLHPNAGRWCTPCTYLPLTLLTTHEATWYIISVVSVSLSVRMYVCMHVCLSVCQPVEHWRKKFIFASGVSPQYIVFYRIILHSSCYCSFCVFVGKCSGRVEAPSGERLLPAK